MSNVTGKHWQMLLKFVKCYQGNIDKCCWSLSNVTGKTLTNAAEVYQMLPGKHWQTLMKFVKYYQENIDKRWWSVSNVTRKTLTNADEVCQMLPWWRKTAFHSINIWDIGTKLCEVYQEASTELNFTLLTSDSTKLAHLSMLSIFEGGCTVSSTNYPKSNILQ